MKLRLVHIALIVILAVVVIVATSTPNVLPYSRSTLFSNMYKYEGMENKTIEQMHSEQKHKVDRRAGSVSGPMPSSDGINKPPPGTPVEGFQSLHPSPLASNAVLDRYSHVSSGTQCVGDSSGLFNSLGGLCLSKKDRRLLATRGGNVTGKDSAIGSQ